MITLARFASCAAVVTFAMTAAAQPRAEEARTHFHHGVELYNEGAFAGALAEFRRAYELIPHARVLFNIGQVYYQQHDYASALPYFERYLAEGGAELTAKQRVEVEQEIGRLRGRVARAEIQSIAGADVILDGEVIGTAPLRRPVLLNAGRHKLAAAKDGYAPASQSIEVVGGETVRIDLSLTEAPRGVAPAPAPVVAVTPRTETARPASPAPVSPAHASTPWLGWVAAGALGAGAIATGVTALHASNDLAAVRDTPGAQRGDLEGAHNRTHGFAVATDVLALAAVATSGITLYLTLSGSPNEPEARQIKVGAAPGGAWAFGHF